jgi:hypothetical protein
MSRIAKIVCVLGAVACVKGNPEPAIDAMPGELPMEGGTIVPPGCGYTVTTRFGAEAPQPGTPDSLGPDPTVFHVHLGLAGDPKTTMAIQWRTRDEQTLATTVRYAAGADLPASALTETHEGFTFKYESTGRDKPRVHEAHLCGLQPDTAYSYQVGGASGGVEAWSPVYTFRTAPDITATPDAEVRFAFVGDSRDGFDIWEMMCNEFASRDPDLILFSGDAVTVGIQQFEWEDFFARAEFLFARVPVVSAHGNHDLNAVHYFSQFAMPGLEENFGIDYGWAHITVANDTPAPPEDVEVEIKAALQADLEASTGARWKIVMHHRPMWSASNHGNDTILQQHWMPLYTQHDVDLVLNGHDHDYEITHPMVWNPTAMTGQVVATPSDGTVFAVSGGAGAELYGAGSDFWTDYSESTHSAALVTVRRDQMTMDAFRADGSLITSGYSETKN